MTWSETWKVSLTVCLAAAATLVAAPTGAEAFCGAYVSGGDAELFNNATHVAMMRHDQTTVLSMQNNYEGPPEDFAMIVPTPVVLQEENVKTLDDEVFSKIDTLTAPRLVEYWEQDPCYQGREYDNAAPGSAGGFDAGAAADGGAANEDGGFVKVEAQFSKGEYNIVVLSSNDSSALTTWLEDNNYNIPQGAGPYLDPYINQGSKFFVAKVDSESEEIEFTEDGQATLSPLRFHYESDEFKLPVRLGLINSKGKQDLIVNVLAKDQRYDVSNYPTATIPTNIEVVSKVKDYFPDFYRALFKETLKKNKKDGQNPVVTEYAWGAQKCDPCPFGMGLQNDQILTLGGDVLADKYEDVGRENTYTRGDEEVTNVTFNYDWVITRLHTRYGEDELGQDLVFEKADPIKGGRGGATDLSHEAESSDRNNFQGRYIIKHAWDGPVDCADPQRGNWGGRHGGGPGINTSPGETNQEKTSDDGTDMPAPKEVNLEDEVKEDIQPLGVTSRAKNQDDGIEWTGDGNDNGGSEMPGGGSGNGKTACSQTGGGPLAPVFAVLGLFGAIALRRRRRDG